MASKEVLAQAEEFVSQSLRLGECGIFSAHLESDLPKGKRIEEVLSILSSRDAARTNEAVHA